MEMASGAVFTARITIAPVDNSAAIANPHIVQVYDTGEFDGLDYLVMEYVHGVNLRYEMNQQGTFSVRETLRIIGETLDGLASRMEPAAPWQFISGYYQYRQQLTSLNSLLNENNALPPLANFKDSSGDAPRTLVLVIGESTQRGRMSLYGYPRATTPKLDAIRDQLQVFDNVVTPRPYTIEALQQVLTFADQENPDAYLNTPSLVSVMKQAG